MTTKRPKPGTDWKFSAIGPKVDRLSLNSEKHPSIFDELQVDGWLHIEQMNSRHWWMRLGEQEFSITFDHTNKATITQTYPKQHEKK